ncbi:solute carrier family 6 (neurotransmitter transporter, GABA) member 1 [Sarotherodon galilaeus]
MAHDSVTGSQYPDLIYIQGREGLAPHARVPTYQLPARDRITPDGWSKAIRSKYSSPGACSLSLPQTPHRHTLLRQEAEQS